MARASTAKGRRARERIAELRRVQDCRSDRQESRRRIGSKKEQLMSHVQEAVEEARRRESTSADD